MPARVQNLVYALSKGRQANISTAALSYLRFRKLNMDVHTPIFRTENDAQEIGKGNEFATQTFPVAHDSGGRIQKYGSAEFVTWGWAYALGNVVEVTSGSTYTITPIDPCQTLELPYFTTVQQLCEGGGTAIDEAYLGCAIEDITLNYKYGAGRSTVTQDVNWIGSGAGTLPSAIVVPTTLSEHYMLSNSMALTILTTDYVANKKIIRGTMGWKNNLLQDLGYAPGSGLQDNAAIRNRLMIGPRVPTFTFDVMLTNNNDEYTKLINQTSGTGVVTMTFDATHTVTWTWEKLVFSAREIDNIEGLVLARITATPEYDSVNGVLSMTAKCGLDGITDLV